jgi:aminoglycoside phosphotransferase
MHQPHPWRDTVDPFKLPLKDFRIEHVLGYPHAGNDVFHAEGVFRGERFRAYVKVERQCGADLLNEAQTLALLPFSFAPPVIEYGKGPPRYLVTAELPGKRLSQILGENENLESLDYLAEYGRTLAQFHGLDLARPNVKSRRFFELPDHAFFEKHGLEKAEAYLLENPPVGASTCFVHGDCYYANVLWEGEKVSAVLDYELSGTGIREFDLAWALVLRPGQKFLKTAKERERFLSGYAETLRFSMPALVHYFLLVSCHFYPLGNEAYQQEIKRILDETILRQSL